MNGTTPTEIPGISLPSAPGNKFKVVIKIIIPIVVALAVLAGASLATRIWDPVWNPFRPEPEKVIETMSSKMEEVKTIHSEFKIDIKADDTKINQKMDISFVFKGDSDLTNLSNPKAKMDLEADISAIGGTMPFSVSLGVKIIAIGEDFYLLINKITAPLLEQILAMSGFDLNIIRNKWIKIDKQSLETLQQLGGGTIPESQEPSAEEKAIQEKALKLFSEAKLYYVKKELSDKTIDGKKAYNYQFVLDRGEIIKVMAELLHMQIMEGELDKELVEQTFGEFFNKVGEITGEILIGKKDNLLYGISLEKEIDVSKLDSSSKGTLGIKFELRNSKFEEMVVITPPADPEKLETILGPFIEIMVRQSQEKAKDARIMADMSQLRTMAEIIYSDTNSYLSAYCTNKKYSEMKAICDDIQEYAGAKPVIRQSKNKYCAYTTLVGKENNQTKYFCVDSSGRAVETIIIPGGKGYCTKTTFVCPAETL